MRVLLTGGAGYVGSTCFRALRRAGIEAFVLDDLSEGHAAAVDPARLVVADIRDAEEVARALRGLRIDHVMHFAAKISVPHSIADPAGYWSVNVDGSRSLLEAMRATGVARIVFSSTAAVYAHGLDRPIRETDPIAPATPYGTSKLAVEHLLAGYAAAYGIGAVALRYFNACGAEPDGAHGEAHGEETHVIPLLLETALGRRAEFAVNGADWPTPDGSCVRDFVSVTDLAEAHRLALGRLTAGRFEAFNLGTGVGVSVLELLAAVARVTGIAPPSTIRPRRAGDPAWLVADPSRAAEALGWRARRSAIDGIVAAAWAWHAAGGRARYLDAAAARVAAQ